jgi:hypothetical protein
MEQYRDVIPVPYSYNLQSSAPPSASGSIAYTTEGMDNLVPTNQMREENRLYSNQSGRGRENPWFHPTWRKDRIWFPPITSRETILFQVKRGTEESGSGQSGEERTRF